MNKLVKNILNRLQKKKFFKKASPWAIAHGHAKSTFMGSNLLTLAHYKNRIFSRYIRLPLIGRSASRAGSLGFLSLASPPSSHGDHLLRSPHRIWPQVARRAPRWQDLRLRVNFRDFSAFFSEAIGAVYAGFRLVHFNSVLIFRCCVKKIDLDGFCEGW